MLHEKQFHMRYKYVEFGKYLIAGIGLAASEVNYVGNTLKLVFRQEFGHEQDVLWIKNVSMIFVERLTTTASQDYKITRLVP